MRVNEETNCFHFQEDQSSLLKARGLLCEMKPAAAAAIQSDPGGNTETSGLPCANAFECLHSPFSHLSSVFSCY